MNISAATKMRTLATQHNDAHITIRRNAATGVAKRLPCRSIERVAPLRAAQRNLRDALQDGQCEALHFSLWHRECG